MRGGKVVKLHLQPVLSSGHQERGVLGKTFEKTKKQNRTSGPSAAGRRTTSLVGWLSSPCSRTMGMSSFVIQRTTLPRPVPQYRCHPLPPMSPVSLTKV